MLTRPQSQSHPLAISSVARCVNFLYTEIHGSSSRRRPSSPDLPQPYRFVRASLRGPTPHPKRRFFVNKSLFSQHYLAERLPQLPEWEADTAAAFDRLRQLWDRAAEFGAGWNEAQTEEEFIKPVLSEVLGWPPTPCSPNRAAAHSFSARITRSSPARP